MKWILIIYFLMTTTFNFAQTKIESITQIPIKLKIAGEKMQKGYLMDIDQTTLTFFTNKKHLKQNLLNACQSCQKIALDDLEKLTIRSTKQHTGKMLGGMIALLMTGIAALSPAEDVPNVASIAGVYGMFYGVGGIGLGAVIDGVANKNRQKALNNYPKTRLIANREVDFNALNHFIDYSPLAQFERLQRQQQLALQETLKEIVVNPLMHQQRFSFFSKGVPVISGYLIESDDTHIFLTNNLFSVVEDRAERPTGLKKVKISNIYYYQID